MNLSERISGIFKKKPSELANAIPITPIESSPRPIYTMDNPWPFMVPQSPKKHPYDAVTTDTWRNIAKKSDILASVIGQLKREVCTVPIEVVAREDEDCSDSTKIQIQKATRFFDSMSSGLGGYGNRRHHFETALLDDLLTIGAVALHVSRNAFGEIIEIIPIDVTTIRPVIDGYGYSPELAFEQYIMGVKTNSYTKDELIYDGLYPQTWTPYFQSPVEILLSPLLSSIKADEWNRMWLTHGNTPADLVSLPENWTPDQIRQFVAYWEEALAGNTPERVKTKFIPGGSNRLASYSRKDNEFQEFEQWLMKRICSVYGVQPASIGYGDLQYKTSQKNSTDITSMYGAGVLLEFRKSLYDEILNLLGYSNLEIKNITPWEEDSSQRADRVLALYQGGLLSKNEARKELGLDPMPETKPAVSKEPDEFVTEDRVLSNWKNKAIKRFKEGKSLAFNFDSKGLPAAQVNRIEKSLPSCTSLEAIVTLFRGEE